VPLDLAEDGGRGERRELDAPRQIEAIHRLDQADGAHLHEVVRRLPAVPVAAGEVPDQRKVHRDEFVANGGPARILDSQVCENGEQFALAQPLRLAPTACSTRCRRG
jgi:hypothetical protein